MDDRRERTMAGAALVKQVRHAAQAYELAQEYLYKGGRDIGGYFTDVAERIGTSMRSLDATHASAATSVPAIPETVLRALEQFARVAAALGNELDTLARTNHLFSWTKEGRQRSAARTSSRQLLEQLNQAEAAVVTAVQAWNDND
ncbi:hypothetical protein D0T12_16665 [Actinomadura spongiicola]|uniref:Uncharacterized protein n=2 Tax=Actinomadura spongiicola TaxID=2303421 RepID=A0A372GFJ8_9ACTN|nr:hypothetical protein D0T12_16665 [Actinomadura spongiicola]